MDYTVFRKAELKDLYRLRPLARNSEGIWSFSEEFLNVFDAKYNIDEEFLAAYPVYIMERGEGLLGFWGLIPKGRAAWLEYFYIDASKTRKGLGKALLGHLKDYCRKARIEKLEFVTSQPALKFYERCGARVTGSTVSSIDGREIPQLEIIIK